ncbi:MAG: HlyD family secretion protein [Hyalangium sp.]|uniref:HlyD family secretion protein n=1 Tax=Hyalangium sp. TaxID=2028555 RepID=UPI00389B1B1A
MSQFPRVMQSLRSERFRHLALWIILGLAVCGAWAAWLLLARVSVYASSSTARLETQAAAFAIQTPLDGRLAAIHAQMGQQLQPGAPLFELDSHAEQLQLEERQQRLTTLSPGEQLASQAEMARLRYEIERRTLRAPSAGTLADLSPLQVGAVVRAGDRLATIIPPGDLRIVAEFTPAAALGRIQVGQRGELRLDAFPWTQFGTLAATVSQVAGEVRDGRIRVELAITPGSSSAIPLQHGLPGTLEIEVERVSPAMLAFRSAGQRLQALSHPAPEQTVPVPPHNL